MKKGTVHTVPFLYLSICALIAFKDLSLITCSIRQASSAADSLSTPNAINAAAFPAGNHSNRFAAVAAQGEQKRIEIFIISFNPLNDKLLAFLCN